MAKGSKSGGGGGGRGGRGKRLNPAIVEQIRRLPPGAQNKMLSLSQSLKGRSFTGHTDAEIGDVGVLKSLERGGFIKLKSGVNLNATTNIKRPRFSTRIAPTSDFREGVRTLKQIRAAREATRRLEDGLR